MTIVRVKSDRIQPDNAHTISYLIFFVDSKEGQMRYGYRNKYRIHRNISKMACTITERRRTGRVVLGDAKYNQLKCDYDILSC